MDTMLRLPRAPDNLSEVRQNACAKIAGLNYSKNSLEKPNITAAFEIESDDFIITKYLLENSRLMFSADYVGVSVGFYSTKKAPEDDVLADKVGELFIDSRSSNPIIDDNSMTYDISGYTGDYESLAFFINRYDMNTNSVYRHPYLILNKNIGNDKLKIYFA